MQARANAFVNDVKKNENVWRLCCERFSMSPYPEVKFWCLQTLHEVRAVLLRLAARPGGRGHTTGGGAPWLQTPCMPMRECSANLLPGPLSLTEQVLKASYNMFPEQARAEVGAREGDQIPALI